jgi:hypothetical protein
MTYVRVATRGAAEATYQLQSVDEAPAPPGQVGIWQRYVITQGGNTIVGMRAGLPAEVSLVAAGFVDRLNARFLKQQARQPAR